MESLQVKKLITKKLPKRIIKKFNHLNTVYFHNQRSLLIKHFNEINGLIYWKDEYVTI